MDMATFRSQAMKINHKLEMPKADPIAAALAQTQKEAGSGAEEEEEDEGLDQVARAGGYEGSASEEEFEHADGQDPLGEEDQEESEEEAAEEDEREDENAAAARAEMCREAAQALVGATRGSTGMVGATRGSTGMTPPDARADTRAGTAAATRLRSLQPLRPQPTPSPTRRSTWRSFGWQRTQNACRPRCKASSRATRSSSSTSGSPPRRTWASSSCW
jgi:hypothetical protein